MQINVWELVKKLEEEAHDYKCRNNDRAKALVYLHNNFGHKGQKHKGVVKLKAIGEGEDCLVDLIKQVIEFYEGSGSRTSSPTMPGTAR